MTGTKTQRTPKAGNSQSRTREPGDSTIQYFIAGRRSIQIRGACEYMKSLLTLSLIKTGLYRHYQFHAAHRITHAVDESCRCSGDAVIQAEIKVLEYLIGINAAGHLTIESLKVK